MIETSRSVEICYDYYDYSMIKTCDLSHAANHDSQNVE